MSEKFEEKEERDLESMAVRPAPLDGGVEGGSTYATDGVQRGLSSRHMSMIAIGGVLGTGLFVSSASALAQGGPVGILLAFSIMGLVVYSTMVAAGEMAALYPRSGGFVFFSTRFVDPAMGMALGWNYWYSLAITIPTEITGGAIIIKYWDTANVFKSEYTWTFIFMVLLAVVNFSPVRVYGEVEFWIASIKVITAIVLIITLIVIDLGGGPTGDRIGFRYWINPGPFTQLNDIQGALGRFLAFWSVFLRAAFSYLGSEVLVLASAEAKNPQKTIPRATKAVFYRILFFYVLGVFVIGLTVPSNDPKLATGSGSASGSPFVIAIERAGIHALPSIVNAVILTSTFSAGSSFTYAASRSLYGLALDRQAPQIFATLKNGIPIWATALTISFGFLSFLTLSSGPSVVFDWFFTLSSVSGIFAWMCILGSYLRFRAACDAQGVDRATFPYRAPFQPYLSYFGFLFLVLVVVFNGFEVFLEGNWSVSDFIAAYISIPIFFIFYFTWKLAHKTKWIGLLEMDLSGRMEIVSDDEEETEKPAWYIRAFQAVAWS